MLLAFELQGPGTSKEYHGIPVIGHTFNADTWVSPRERRQTWQRSRGKANVAEDAPIEDQPAEAEGTAEAAQAARDRWVEMALAEIVAPPFISSKRPSHDFRGAPKNFVLECKLASRPRSSTMTHVPSVR